MSSNSTNKTKPTTATNTFNKNWINPLPPSAPEAQQPQPHTQNQSQEEQITHFRTVETIAWSPFFAPQTPSEEKKKRGWWRKLAGMGKGKARDASDQADDTKAKSKPREGPSLELRDTGSIVSDVDLLREEVGERKVWGEGEREGIGHGGGGEREVVGCSRGFVDRGL
jgi:hypothetical protein